MSKAKQHSERSLFFKRFLACPSRVGSIIPSSPFLAKKMIKKEELDKCKSIAEFGAGTGVFTQQIIKQKPGKCELYVFERDPQLASCLKSKFPYIKLYNEAAQVGDLTRRGEMGRPDLIISGIPFAVLEPSLREKILLEAYDVLPSGGKFITFQYSTNLLSYLKKLYSSVELEFVLFNIPPAIVYRCTKK